MKFKIFLLLFLTRCFSCAVSSDKRRILYGEKVTTKHSLIASLLYDEGEDNAWIRTNQFLGRDSDYYQLICGGFIVSNFYVLTAAHCIKKAGDNIHLVGVDGLNFREMSFYHRIVNKIAHPDYTDNKDGYVFKSDNDIGLVKTLSQMAKLGPPTRFNPSSDYILNHPIMLYGWGLTENNKTSDHLKQINLVFATDISVYKDVPAVKAGRVLCFRVPKEGGRAGNGDSGSPIMINAMNPSEKNVILSLGATYAELNEQADKHFFSVLGPNLTYYFDWMVETINNN